jgi:sialate O-acetylesterase
LIEGGSGRFTGGAPGAATAGCLPIRVFDFRVSNPIERSPAAITFWIDTMKTRITLLALACAPALPADVKLPAIFSDHMVLQRDVEAPVWGWADAGEKVTVSFAGQNKSTTADATGKWSVKLAKLPASAQARDLKVKGNNEITLENVLVGDVWICSGQSNMEWPLSKCTKSPKEEAAAQKNNKQLRLFRIPEHVKAPEPALDTKGTWKTTGKEEDCLPFSGCGFFFGAKLQKELDIPIGLIDTSWGGTPVDQWISNKAHQAFLKSDRKESIYNGMVAPLVPFAIKGAIWYQGESNAGKSKQYQTLFPAMIADWRARWKQGDFPFFFVQIAPFNGQPPEIREAQFLTLGKVKNTAMAVTTDVGNATDIHPNQKEPVGQRLALAARALTYGEKIEYSGPLYDSWAEKGGKIIINFKRIGGGLVAKDGELKGFTIAGADKKFVPAQAKIEGDTVVVSADGVTNPKAVRYGWANVPDVNLFNKEGLPASPFRTDVE